VAAETKEEGKEAMKTKTWKKMLARHGEASNVVARYWYVRGQSPVNGHVHAATSRSGEVHHAPGDDGVGGTKETTRRCMRDFHAYKCMRLEDVRRVKAGMTDRGYIHVKAVLVTVRMVPKGGPKTVPSQKMPSEFPPSGRAHDEKT
jgi:hypothetical protein